MSDTPRTDAQILHAQERGQNICLNIVSAEFARELERELNERQYVNSERKTFGDGLLAAADYLDRQIAAMAAHTNQEGIVSGEDFYFSELVILRSVAEDLRKKLVPSSISGSEEKTHGK